MADNSQDTSTIDSAVKIRRNKCFKEDYSGFDCIKPINIIIGRNNSGKSVLLDMIEFLLKTKHPTQRVRESDDASKGILDSKSEFSFKRVLSEDTLKRIFPLNTSGGKIGGNYWNECGRHLLSCPIEFRVDFELKTQTVKLL